MNMFMMLVDISPDTWSQKITDVAKVVGRAEEADIRLESRFVSKAHCRFWKEGEDYFVEDCGSTNGTYVRGERIEKKHLKSGDRVLVGNFELLIADEASIQPTDYELPTSDTVIDSPTLDLTQAAKEAAALAQPVDEDRRLAAAVHQRLTPSRRIGLPGMLVEVAYQPSGVLGGDCFHCFALDDRWVLALFDSMNHGVRAALAITLIRSELSRWVSLTPEPGRCLEHLNHELVSLGIDDLYICATLAMWFPVTSTLVYATAGQHAPLVFRGGVIQHTMQAAGGFPLGTVKNDVFEEQMLQLRPHDRIYFFTDGVGDALRDGDKNGKKTGSAGTLLAEELSRRGREGLSPQVSHILEGRPGRFPDDALLVGCEVGSAVESLVH